MDYSYSQWVSPFMLLLCRKVASATSRKHHLHQQYLLSIYYMSSNLSIVQSMLHARVFQTVHGNGTKREIHFDKKKFWNLYIQEAFKKKKKLCISIFFTQINLFFSSIFLNFLKHLCRLSDLILTGIPWSSHIIHIILHLKKWKCGKVKQFVQSGTVTLVEEKRWN